jgi:FkbM family methyltransferase
MGFVRRQAGRVVRGLLERLGYRLISVGSYSDVQWYLDSVFRILLSQLEREGQLEDFYFVQVGGYDGRSGDPIYEFITKFQWKGVICEPQTEAFRRLTWTYRGRPGIALENAAIHSESATRNLYFLMPSNREDIPEWVYQMSSVDPSFINEKSTGVPGIETLVARSEVPCLTIKDLVSKHHLPRIDLLQVDTEGYDFEVLKLIDFEEMPPRIIRYEHKHLSPEDRGESAKLLLRHGYQVVFERSDAMGFKTG